MNCVKDNLEMKSGAYLQSSSSALRGTWEENTTKRNVDYTVVNRFFKVLIVVIYYEQ